MNPESLATSDRDEFLHNLAYAMCRWKYAILGIFALTVFMVFFAGYMLTPSWKAEVYLLAEPTLTPPRSAFPDPTRVVTRQTTDLYSQHLIRILQGKEMALAIVDRFDLAERKRQKAEEPANLRESLYASIFGTLDVCIYTVIGILTGDWEKKEADWRDKAAQDVREGIFAWVAADLVRETDIVELLVNGESPALANDVAQFMIEQLRVQLAAISATAGEAAVAAFRQELDQTILRQEEAEQALNAFLEAHQGMQPSEVMRIKTADLTRLQAEQNRLISERAELERQREERRGAGASTHGGATLSDRMLRNPAMQQLQARLNEMRVALATLLAEVTEAHPDVLALRTQIRQTLSEMDRQLDQALLSVEADLRSKRQEVAEIERELTALPAREFEHARLAMNVDVARQLRRDLQAHVEALTVNTQTGIGSLAVNVIDIALVSPVASSDMPSWMIVALVAIAFGAGVALVVPPFVEYWRDPIRGPVDLITHGLTPLGVIPEQRLAKGRPRGPTDAREEFSS